MNLSAEQQKKLLAVLLVLLVVLIGYRVATSEKQRTVPLTYERGAVSTSPIRAQSAAADPLQLFFVKRSEKFPGVARDIFRMENPAPPKPVVKTAPTPSVPPPPPIPVKTPEEIAAEASRAELATFRFIGYLTDKDSSLFLSKDGELYIVRSGDAVLKNYRVKEAGKDFIILFDTVTRVERRIELSGGAESAAPGQRPGR